MARSEEYSDVRQEMIVQSPDPAGEEGEEQTMTPEKTPGPPPRPVSGVPVNVIGSLSIQCNRPRVLL